MIQTFVTPCRKKKKKKKIPTLEWDMYELSIKYHKLYHPLVLNYLKSTSALSIYSSLQTFPDAPHTPSPQTNRYSPSHSHIMSSGTYHCIILTAEKMCQMTLKNNTIWAITRLWNGYLWIHIYSHATQAINATNKWTSSLCPSLSSTVTLNRFSKPQTG